jgi:hypothetical protein
MALILFAVLFALTVGLLLVPGAQIAAVVPFVAAIAMAVWLVLAHTRGNSPSRAIRRTHDPELFGPGGPDDPEAGR